jgi:membrane-associated phospholipid phosphatase
LPFWHAPVIVEVSGGVDPPRIGRTNAHRPHRPAIPPGIDLGPGRMVIPRPPRVAPVRSVRTLAALALLLAATHARAEPRPLRLDLPVDLAVTAGALAIWGGTAAGKAWLAPATCGICEPSTLDTWARDRLVWDDVGLAEIGSNLLAYVVLPVSAAGFTLAASRASGGSWGQGFTDLLVVTEAAALSGTVSQLVKLAVGRPRPFIHDRNLRQPDRRPRPDDILSFYSGHTALAFSLATATSTVARLRGERAAPWLLGLGLGAGVTVGWLAIADDKHYLTDVVTGAVIGSAIGWGVPWLLHRSRGGAAAPAGSARVAPTPLPIGLVMAF